MLQRLVKAGVARALWGTRTDEWIGAFRGARLRPLVLGYHRVVPHPAGTARWLPGMAVSRDMLERHLDWLGRSHRFVSLDELGEKIAAGDPFERQVAAVTFDDGYADVYENAFPLLRRKGIPAAVFVVTDLVGTAALPLHDRLYLMLRRLLARGGGGGGRLRSFLESQGIPPASWRPVAADAHRALVFLLRRLPRGVLVRLAEDLEREVGVDPEARRELRPVTWSMLRAMQEGGLTVGSHTRSHALLTNDPTKTSGTRPRARGPPSSNGSAVRSSTSPTPTAAVTPGRSTPWRKRDTASRTRPAHTRIPAAPSSRSRAGCSGRGPAWTTAGGSRGRS